MQPVQKPWPHVSVLSLDGWYRSKQTPHSSVGPPPPPPPPPPPLPLLSPTLAAAVAVADG